MAPLNKSLKTKSRTIKMTTQTLLDFDLGEESSSDSDFRIEDHDESDDEFSEQNNDDDSDNDDDDDDDDDSDSDSESDEKSDKYKSIQKNNDNKNNKTTEGEKSIIDLKEILSKTAAENSSAKQKIPTQPICCACLGDRSDDTNEIIECDGCGVSVHEGCYGVSDTNSISSTNSSCSTEPWFCEACRAGVIDPNCELCPNIGGIFKETDVGKWVHLVCALYVPGVAFGEVDQLSSVTLFEMPYNKWGAKSCSLCIDERFSRTGVCIGCDAGMCKSYFHVTCAQAAGFLSEAHSEEVDHADPFYAHCKVHSDKTMIKHRKRNYNTLKFRMEQKKQLKLENEKSNEKLTTEQQRIQRKLAKHQAKYRTNKALKNEPWVPTQKISRLLTTSATAVKRLLSKADVMGIDTAALEFQEAQMASLVEVKKKWHIPPAFSVEFIAYYLDRITRLKDLKTNLTNYVENNSSLLNEQKRLREEYDQKIKTNSELLSKNNNLKDSIAELHKQISILCPAKQLLTIENIGRPVIPNDNIPSTSQQPLEQQPQQQPQQQQQQQPARPISVPTAAALKMGVGFPLTNLPGGIKDDTGRILSTQRQNKDELLHDCGICKRCNDQHLLAKCDTCHFYYHLGCLNPPLTRHPKKSKLYGWQCSECDKSDDSDIILDIPKGPRKSRTRFSKDGTIVPVDPNYSADGNSSTKSEFSPTKRKLSTEKLQMPAPAQKSKSVDSVNSIITTISSTSINNSTTTSTTTFNGKIIVPKEFNNTPKKPYIKISKNINQQQLTQINHNKNLLNNFEKIDIIDNNDNNEIITTNLNETIPINNNLSNEIITKKSHKKLENSIKISSPINILKSQLNDPLAINCNDINLQTNEIILNTSRKSSSKNKDKSIKKEKKERKNCIKSMELLNKIKNENDSIISDLQTDQSIMIADIDPANVTTTTTTTTTTSEQDQLQLHKQNRKRRKDKHKSKYNSDSEKSPNKEHKRKRKKKTHDMENPNDSVSTVPKIKIKFKTLPLPGEAAPEPQFFYVSADMVRPMDTSRPTSVETVDDSTINNDDLAHISSPSFEEKLISNSTNFLTTKSIKNLSNRSPNKIKTSTPKSSSKTATNTIITPKLSTTVAKLSSPRRTSINKRRSTNSNTSMTTTSSANNSVTQINGPCDVCHDKVTNQNSVQCDECHKIYHFTCLDPPLKKSPKRRGYSWHCADCDPTDIEGT